MGSPAASGGARRPPASPKARKAARACEAAGSCQEESTAVDRDRPGDQRYPVLQVSHAGYLYDAAPAWPASKDGRRLRRSLR